MDQEKIGKFICELRKEKGMTQQELAIKLGVTDKAISKWENGRCMMDISMLSPLSEILNVSVIELINGQIMDENDKYLKVDKTIDNALKYTHNKTKKIINLIACMLLIVMIISFTLLAFFVYKFAAAEYIYDVELIDNDKLVSELSMNKNMEIRKKTIDEDKYIYLDNVNVKIRNDFDTIIYEDNNDRYLLYDNNKKDIGGINIGISETYINEFKNEKYGSFHNYGIDWLYDKIDIKDKEKFLQKNNIKNDIDLFKYISKNYYYYYYRELNWSYDIKSMKDYFMFNTMIFTDFQLLNSAVLITGDYYGYILTYDYSDFKFVSILKDDVIYWLTFFGDEYTTDEYINDILSTLIIY